MGAVSSSDDRFAKKIRKLLALAEDPAATPAEAAAFTEKAVLLMARHGIDEAMIGKDAGSGVVFDRRFAFAAPYSHDKALLASRVALAMRCRAIMIRSGQSTVIHVFGLETDVSSVDTLVRSLQVQASHELARAEIPATDHVAAFRRSWWAGFSFAVYERLAEANRRAEADAAAGEVHRNGSGPQAEGPSVALVLANRADEIEDEVSRQYPRLKPAERRRLSGGGMRDGYLSGQRADLSTQSKLPVR
jgi:hypothetical protein